MKIKLVAIVIVGLLAFSRQGMCQKNEFTNYDYLEREIIGHWITESMLIQVRTYQKTDTSFTVDVRDYDWEMKMNYQPPEIDIMDDGTYSSVTRDYNGMVQSHYNGKWWIDGDLLYMEDQNGKLFEYKIFIDKNKMEMTSYTDWDDDGDKDDVYYGRQIKR